MNPELKQQIWKAQFSPTEEAAAFEEQFRKFFGLQRRYEASRLLIGRSLAEPTHPDPLPASQKYCPKPIPGEYLFGENEDLWLCAIVTEGRLGASATLDDFRTQVEAHWARGFRLLKDELEACQRDPLRLIQRVSDLLPEVSLSAGTPAMSTPVGVGEVRIKLGSVSTTLNGDKPIDFAINASGVAPHTALMGKNGSGKTTTGVQMALELVDKSKVPFLLIDPKGEFVKDGAPVGAFGNFQGELGAIEVGTAAIPLDFLPLPDAPANRIAKAAMALRDTIALCCSSVGDLQRDTLRTVVQDILNDGTERSLVAVRDAYERALIAGGKQGIDSVVSRLNELTNPDMPCFEPRLSPAEFFGKSWIISLKELPEDLKRLVTLLLLDSISSFLLEQADSPVSSGGHRTLRHLLVVDEARKILREKKSESLVDLIRKGRSKGSVVVLLSQDPSDFEGQAEDFLSQLGTVVAFACNQTKSGLSALSGVFGRKLQAAEFSDTQLAPGIAFVKLPGRQPERIRCWQAPVG
jgi:hypothetical protein